MMEKIRRRFSKPKPQQPPVHPVHYYLGHCAICGRGVYIEVIGASGYPRPDINVQCAVCMGPPSPMFVEQNPEVAKQIVTWANAEKMRKKRGELI